METQDNCLNCGKSFATCKCTVLIEAQEPTIHRDIDAVAITIDIESLYKSADLVTALATITYKDGDTEDKLSDINVADWRRLDDASDT